MERHIMEEILIIKRSIRGEWFNVETSTVLGKGSGKQEDMRAHFARYLPESS